MPVNSVILEVSNCPLILAEQDGIVPQGLSREMLNHVRLVTTVLQIHQNQLSAQLARTKKT